MKCDVAIIGGGPAGSTVGSLLKKYSPQLDVAIFESAQFPRDHVGESLLPACCGVLAESGAWDKVEEAGFPVKLGGLYRWGATEDIYPLAFLRGEEYEDKPRPAKYEGQRTLTAFQVDRGIFDKILLDHAESLGCRVFEQTPVASVERDGDRVTGLVLGSDKAGDTRVEAEYYVDASGNRGILRKAFGVNIEAPSSLRNIAVYDYWQGADWGTRAGVDGTNIHVMSIEWGWLWFIAMGKTRTSVGLVTSAEYYKKSGLSTEELYLKGISCQPLISQLLEGATRENCLKAESDWSYVSDRLAGENWFLAGDSSGFADPILSAGLTLAMTGARKVAYTLSELKFGSLEADWVKSEYERVQKGNIRDHIRFADYWYSVNAKFTDLKEYCREICKDAGLNLNADEAFRWLGNGGFTGDAGGYESPSAASFRLSTVKTMVEKFGGEAPEWQLQKYKKIRLNLEGAIRETAATYNRGHIEVQQVYRRGQARLFLHGFYKRAYVVLLQEENTDAVVEKIYRYFRPRMNVSDPLLLTFAVEVLEAMFVSGWIEGIEA
jgi:flavin-dependent dehydrogenase